MTNEPTHDAAGHVLPCSCNAGTRQFDPIDVDAYEAAGVARVEQAQEPDCCEDGCVCHFPSPRDLDDGYDDDEYDDNGCEHCPNCCSCTPCMYAHHA